MTPEQLHELGKRVAIEIQTVACDEANDLQDCPSRTPPEGWSFGDVVVAVEELVRAEPIQNDEEELDGIDVAHALRGSVAFFRELADELEARAVSIEASR
jgi:hypothetical protein